MHDEESNLYIFRLVATDPAHQPTDVSEVAEQVTADWKKQWAFDQAKAEAQRIIDATNTTDLAAAAGERCEVLTLML